MLHQLAALPRDTLLEHARIRDRKHPGYVPNECLLHFVRASRSDNSDAWFERLYKILVQRVLNSVPREGAGDTALTAERIRNSVFDRFVEMLIQDRREPGDRLDFFEVRFDLGVKRLRLDAQETAWREENRSTAMDDEDDGAPTAAIEASAVDFIPLDHDLSSEVADLNALNAILAVIK